MGFDYMFEEKEKKGQKTGAKGRGGNKYYGMMIFVCYQFHLYFENTLTIS